MKNKPNNKWEQYLLYGGPVPDITENWPTVPQVES